MPNTTLIETLLATLALNFSSQVATPQETTIWSGRLLRAAASATLSQTSTGARVVSGEAILSLPDFIATPFGAAVCSRGDDALLTIVGTRAGEAQWVSIAQTDATHLEVVDNGMLPAAAIGRPAVLTDGLNCKFGVAMVDGSVAIGLPGHFEIESDLYPKLRDAAEHPRGILSIGTSQGVLVVAVDTTLVAFDPAQSVLERKQLSVPLVPGAIAARDENLIVALDARGTLVAYRPFSMAPVQLRDPGSPAPGGLSVLSDQDGAERALVWGTLDGRVLAFDGQNLRELAAYGAPISHPLLAADILDTGSPQLIVPLDDGSFGLWIDLGEGQRAERFAAGVRASHDPVLTMSAEQGAPRLAVANGSRSFYFSLGQPTASDLLKTGTSVSPGERMDDGMSTAHRTAIEIVLADTGAASEEREINADHGDTSGTAHEERANQGAPFTDLVARNAISDDSTPILPPAPFTCSTANPGSAGRYDGLWGLMLCVSLVVSAAARSSRKAARPYP